MGNRRAVVLDRRALVREPRAGLHGVVGVVDVRGTAEGLGVEVLVLLLGRLGGLRRGSAGRCRRLGHGSRRSRARLALTRQRREACEGSDRDRGREAVRRRSHRPSLHSEPPTGARRLPVWPRWPTLLRQRLDQRRGSGGLYAGGSVTALTIRPLNTGVK